MGFELQSIFLEVIENMQREMGFEPTASSLGIFTSIEYKGYGARGDAHRPSKFSELTQILAYWSGNGVEESAGKLGEKAIIRSETRRLGARFRLRFRMGI
jgi:hypothetical protein